MSISINELTKMTFGDIYKYCRSLNEDANGEDVNGDGKVDEKDAEVKELLSKLKNTEGIDNLIDALNGLKSEQMALLKTAFGKGENAEKVDTSKQAISVLKLIPTQNEIDVANSLAFPLKCENPETAEQIKTILGGKEAVTVVRPLVVYNKGGKYYIIDGHHRWSQVYLLNVNAKINCIVFNGSAGETEQSPIDVLRDFQGAVKVAAGKVVRSTVKEGRNLFDWSIDQIKQYVIDTATEPCVKAFSEHFNKDVTKEMIADRVGVNAQSMKDHNKPIEGAPKRPDMPQTDAADNKALAVAVAGMSDI